MNPDRFHPGSSLMRTNVARGQFPTPSLFSCGGHQTVVALDLLCNKTKWLNFSGSGYVVVSEKESALRLSLRGPLERGDRLWDSGVVHVAARLSRWSHASGRSWASTICAQKAPTPEPAEALPGWNPLGKHSRGAALVGITSWIRCGRGAGTPYQAG